MIKLIGTTPLFLGVSYLEFFPFSFKILLVAACLQMSFEGRRIVEHGNVMQVRRAKLNDSHFNGGAVRNRQSKGPSQ
jgi:hypothetical protein